MSLESEIAKYEASIQKTYAKAAKEVQKKAQEHAKHFKAQDKIKKKHVKAGEITEADYQSWLAGQVFIGKQWQGKVNSIATTLTNANQIANAMAEERKRAIFGSAAIHEQYEIEHDCKVNLSWDLYDSATVSRLLKKRPELLPRRVLNGVKERAWQKTNIANAVTQGILQGEGLMDVAKRIGKDTATTNMTAMIRYARTAMTGAQNAGRCEAMREAGEMGIKVQKEWIATLDSHTRDAHQELDGQYADVDQPFKVDGMDIMFPGDPNAAPALVYNCRCTLGNHYPEYAFKGKRRDNETGDIIADMPFWQWRAAKQDGLFKELNEAYSDWSYWSNSAIQHDADHVFKGIWKDDVTYADFTAKEPSIQAKLDYYEQEIAKMEAGGHTVRADWLKRKREELLKFQQWGNMNEMILDMRKTTRDDLDSIIAKLKPTQPKRPKAQMSAFDPEAYTQARKDAAVWAKNPWEADKHLRARCGEVWRSASPELRDGIFEYTHSFNKYNEPLRGIEYGTSRFLGVGNTDLNAGYADNGKRLNAMTEIISRSSYNEDFWFQRGVGYSGMDKFFGVDISLLENGTQDELEKALLGTQPIERAFMSCGSSKGGGFSQNPIIFNIYAPAGTEMMYVEPFSWYGKDQNGDSNRDDGIHWDGLTTQTVFGSEIETILQQGTRFRITKVEVSGNWDRKVYVDMEIISQNERQLYTGP